MIHLALPLTTDRLILRDVKGEDTASFAKIIKHPRMLRKIVVKGEEKNVSMYTSFLDGVDAFMDFSLTTQKQKPRTIYSLSVVEKKSDRVIGNIELSQNDIGDIELGYCIHPDFQNQKFATEAVYAICSYAFQHGAHAITATTRSDNKASQLLLKKLGMTLIGYKPTAYNDGQPIREYWMVERIPFLVAQNTVKQKTAAEAAV